jgi:hypothetical protein
MNGPPEAGNGRSRGISLIGPGFRDGARMNSVRSRWYTVLAKISKKFMDSKSRQLIQKTELAFAIRQMLAP